MKSKFVPQSPQQQRPIPVVQEDDYYVENGCMVLTEKYLKQRGYCCQNGCRHCPYIDRIGEYR